MSSRIFSVCERTEVSPSHFSIGGISDLTTTQTRSLNRMRKGDRLPLVPASHRNAVNLPLEINVPRTPAPRDTRLTRPVRHV
jgi:hypothetical protein